VRIVTRSQAAGDDCIIIKSRPQRGRLARGQAEREYRRAPRARALGPAGVGLGKRDVRAGGAHVWVHTASSRAPTVPAHHSNARARRRGRERLVASGVPPRGPAPHGWSSGRRLLLVDAESRARRPRPRSAACTCATSRRGRQDCPSQSIAWPDRPIADGTFPNVPTSRGENGVRCVDAKTCASESSKDLRREPRPAFSIEKTDRVALVRSCPSLATTLPACASRALTRSLTIDEPPGRGALTRASNSAVFLTERLASRRRASRPAACPV